MTHCLFCNARADNPHSFGCPYRKPTYAPDERSPPRAGRTEPRMEVGVRLASGETGLDTGGHVTNWELAFFTMRTRAETAEAALADKTTLHENCLKVIDQLTEQVNAKESHRRANEKAMVEAQRQVTELEGINTEYTTKIDSLTRAIRALAPYRDFFEVIQAVISART